MAAAAEPSTPDELNDKANEFAERYNDWAKYLQSISPHSPDFKEQARAAFQECDLGNLFRKIEEHLR